MLVEATRTTMFSFTQQLIILLIVLLIFYIYLCLSVWPRRGIAHIKPIFPFGNFTGIFIQTESFAQLLQKLYESALPNARYVGIYAGLQPTLLVRDPALITAILVTDFQHFHDRGLYIDERNDPLSANLVTLSGERWRKLRAKLTPAFGVGKLRAMFGCIVASGKSLSERLDTATQEQFVDMHEVVAQYTTNVIASVAFGLDIDCVRVPELPFRVMGRKIFESSVLNGIRDAAGFLFPSLQRVLPFKTIDQDVEDFFVSIVRQNMEHRINTGTTRSDFFQQLVNLSGGTTNGLMECAAQTFIFFAAGFETSSTTMSFALFELARHTDIQRQVQQEIDCMLEKHGEELTYDSVYDLKYLDACIAETLRKYPPLPFLNRECTKDWTIPDTNIVIPKGTPIIVPTHAIQNDAKYYVNPTQFNPNRWTRHNNNNEMLTSNDYCNVRPNNMAFGMGPRNCIGQRLGELQTKVGLVLLLRGHSFHLAGNTTESEELKMSTQNVLLSAVGGVELRVTRRCKH